MLSRLAWLGMVLPVFLAAAPVSPERAAAAAAAWFGVRAEVELRNQGNLYIGTAPGRGYVVLAGDDRAAPVLAYGEGEFPLPVECPEAAYWLNRYHCQLAELELMPESGRASTTGGAPADTSRSFSDSLRSSAEEWIPVFPPHRASSARTPGAGMTTGSPLLRSTWHQNKYYNAWCPLVEGGPDGRAYAGCVAVAMGQVLRYWQQPGYGRGFKSYVHSPLGLQAADFGNTRYDWAGMPDRLSGYNDAVAELLYHCGVSVNMNYSASGSGAVTSKAASALVEYFRFAPSAAVCYRGQYADREWEALLRSELDAGRPVIYRGRSSTSGHAFVCDGCQDSVYFHFNWGWGGGYNGWFLISDLTPGGYDFSLDQFAILGLCPERRPLAPRGVRLSPDGGWLRLSWEAVTSDNYGGEAAVSYYEIMASSAAESGFAALAQTNGTALMIPLGGAPAFYRVTAVLSDLAR